MFAQSAVIQNKYLQYNTHTQHQQNKLTLRIICKSGWDGSVVCVRTVQCTYYTSFYVYGAYCTRTGGNDGAHGRTDASGRICLKKKTKVTFSVSNTESDFSFFFRLSTLLRLFPIYVVPLGKATIDFLQTLKFIFR